MKKRHLLFNYSRQWSGIKCRCSGSSLCNVSFPCQLIIIVRCTEKVINIDQGVRMSRTVYSIVRGSIVVMVTSLIAIPYTVAILCNVVYGWPQGKDKFRRALNPKKVYTLNYAVLQQFCNIRFAPLYYEWTSFYKAAGSNRIVKDLIYGRNENSLDVYYPEGYSGLGQSYPVVIFLYGGSWGSGDKKMYGLLCSQVADKLQCVVCCPNYTLYPKGYVDDMVQDVVDCVMWTQDNICDYNGDRDRIVLLGHSAGAHLCVMAVLELVQQQKRLRPQLSNISLGMSSRSLQFADQFFNNSGQHNRSALDSSSSGSFLVINGESTSRSIQDQGRTSSTESIAGSTFSTRSKSESESSSVVFVSSQGDAPEETPVTRKASSISFAKDVDGKTFDGLTDNNDDDDITIINEELGQGEMVVSLSFPGPLASIRGIIGLAGVYDIAGHYDFEAWRWVEDISAMGKAMYGPEHFDRFSPTTLVKALPSWMGLPKTVLIHGCNDTIVPTASSIKFAESLKQTATDVKCELIPGCKHADVCLDLMNTKRKYHDTVMDLIVQHSQNMLQL